MDQYGVEMQVLSLTGPGPQRLLDCVAVAATPANDLLYPSPPMAVPSLSIIQFDFWFFQRLITVLGRSEKLAPMRGFCIPHHALPGTKQSKKPAGRSSILDGFSTMRQHKRSNSNPFLRSTRIRSLRQMCLGRIQDAMYIDPRHAIFQHLEHATPRTQMVAASHIIVHAA